MEYINKVESILKNPYVTGGLAILAITYGGMIAPELPVWLANILSKPLSKLVVLILIVLTRKISPVLAILVSLCFIISIQSINRHSIHQLTENVVKINKIIKDKKDDEPINPPSVNPLINPLINPPSVNYPSVNAPINSVNSINASNLYSPYSLNNYIEKFTTDIDTTNILNNDNNNTLSFNILDNILSYDSVNDNNYSNVDIPSDLTAEFRNLNNKFSKLISNSIYSHYGLFRESSSVEDLQ